MSLASPPAEGRGFDGRDRQGGKDGREGRKVSDKPDKPAKLPPLPRMRKLPAMPRSARPKHAALPPIPEPDEVEEETVDTLFGPENEISGSAKGATAPGRWFKTKSADGEIGGRCANCGRKRKAENLKLHTIPFSNDQIWVCKEGC